MANQVYHAFSWDPIFYIIYGLISKNYEYFGDNNLFFYYNKLIIESLIKFPDPNIDHSSHLENFIKAASKKIQIFEKNPFDTPIEIIGLFTIKTRDIELFTLEDKILTNYPQKLIKDSFEGSELLSISELNKLSNDTMEKNCTLSWKMISKIIFKNDNEDPLAEFTEDEQIELGFFECKKSEERNSLYQKKLRRIFVNEPFFVKATISNPINAPLEITNLKIMCTNKEVNVEKTDITLTGKETQTILLKATPANPGEIEIKGIEWHISNVIHCVHQFGKETNPFTIKMDVREKGSYLEMSFEPKPKSYSVNGEFLTLNLILKNIGAYEISRVVLGTDFSLIFGFVTKSINSPILPGQQFIVY